MVMEFEFFFLFLIIFPNINEQYQLKLFKKKVNKIGKIEQRKVFKNKFKRTDNIWKRLKKITKKFIKFYSISNKNKIIILRVNCQYL
jgi:hypothetical protein